VIQLPLRLLYAQKRRRSAEETAEFSGHPYLQSGELRLDELYIEIALLASVSLLDRWFRLTRPAQQVPQQSI
jgi:hypothetical protein